MSIRLCAQVEWNNPGDPTKGYKFLYLSDADYSSIAARADTAVLKAEPFFADNGATCTSPHKLIWTVYIVLPEVVLWESPAGLTENKVMQKVLAAA